ncbi:hypothetical protein [Mesorhizobium sp. B2-8-3]|uniref:hypothetical protein n=1 Tax=Mesorhizobium sp. B2-8-3 TaxID=2589905 RepID=UPI00112891B7|nr:hypothetical protein [Mesorhizobium sp. B2-8-3]TPJ27149.1 hypothetical protein FJ418_28710 [Mesorhizobium sp. B2-8-3]
MSGPLNSRFFFDFVRLHLFDGRMSSGQAGGLNIILAKWSAGYAAQDDRWLAYALGTVHHETGRTMQPITEFGGPKYFFNMYDPYGQRPDVARRLGNTERGDGVRFCGRGFVQLTGRANYITWGRLFDTDLTAKPDLVLQPELATAILFRGMINGTFTGSKLADYFEGAKADWVKARRIINGKDRAELVASYAMKYYAAISYTV